MSVEAVIFTVLLCELCEKVHSDFWSCFGVHARDLAEQMHQHVVVLIQVVLFCCLKFVTPLQSTAFGPCFVLGLFGFGFWFGLANTPHLFVACKPDNLEEAALLVGVQAPNTQASHVFLGGADLCFMWMPRFAKPKQLRSFFKVHFFHITKNLSCTKSTYLAPKHLRS